MDILPTKSFYILCLTVLFGIGCAEDDSRNTPMMDMSNPVDPGDMTPPEDMPDAGDPPMSDGVIRPSSQSVVRANCLT